MNMAQTSVVIVNYHSQKLVCRCLASLKQHCRHPLHYFVVDNSIPPEHSLIVAQHSDAAIISPGRNLGFAGGCNLGVIQALAVQSEFILLLNPDAWAENDFLAPLLSALRAHSELGAVGPMILHGDGTRRLWNGGGRLNWWAGGTRRIIQPEPGDGQSIPVDFLSGCAMLLRSDAVRQAGLLTEEYFLYFEDTDYVQSLFRAGWQVAYVPSAVVLHEPSSTTGMQSKNYIYYFSRNRVWFMRRWAKWYHYLVFLIYNTLVKLPGAVIVFGLQRCQSELVWAYFKGYWDGITAYKISAK